MALVDTLTTTGISLLGGTMPVLAPSWTSGTPTVGADGLSLSLSSGTWLAPCHGHVRTLGQVADRSGVFLRDGTGAAVASGASVISLHPQQYLRLARLYAMVLEDETGARPGRAAGQPARPVPAHLVLGTGGVTAGGIDPGDTLVGGTLSVHDSLGQPIDPVAVASAFLAFMTAHHPLQERGSSDPFDATPPLASLVSALATGAASVRVRLVDGAGQPAAGTNLTGLTSVSAGLFTVAGLSSTVGKAAASGGFSEEARRTLVLGLATTGRLGDSVAFPSLPSGRTLQRDFFTVRLVDLAPYLIGTPAAAWDGTKIEPRPAVRRDEPLTLLADGNDVLGAAASALAGTPTESLAVAQRIDGAFAVPSAAGAAAHWPAFPPLGGVTAAAAGAVPLAQAASVVATAAFVTSTTTPSSSDVVLSLTGLPAGAAVRAYSRRFSAEAVESRGDGGGAVVDGAGNATVLLLDPLGLVVYGQAQRPLPASPVLHVDLVVVKRTGEARILGDVSCPITGNAAAPVAGTNPFGTATRRGICHAGILASGEPRTAPAPTVGLPEAALQLFSEGTPRDAPRLPGMARRELIVAGLTGTTWSSVLSGGRLAPELHNASPRIGAPGGRGGRETQTVGVSTSGGRLAFDLARAAFRRTTSIVNRLDVLATAVWDEPAASTTGPFAGAVLQTVAASCESPELGLLRTTGILDPSSPTLPRTFDELVTKAKEWLQELVAGASLPSALATRATTLIDKLDDLRDDAPADESRKERLFNEILREIAASGWGRRDAQWALAGAFARAERFVYIETPGVGQTAVPATTEAFARDLFEVLSARMAANPALHVVVCTPEVPDYPFGFNPFTDDELSRRRAAILGLPTANVADAVGNRVVAFHPVGFPGRPSRLESTTVIVDDVWAMVGASTLRRRGLSFDGATDLVLTGQDLVEGRSAAIAALRRSIQASRLGITVPAAASSGVPPLPSSSFVRLADGVEAFHEIREMLRGGGLGRITRLTPADPVGRPPTTPTPDPDVVNPDSETYDLVRTLVTLAFAGGAAL
jgi:hypothetical protein